MATPGRETPAQVTAPPENTTIAASGYRPNTALKKSMRKHELSFSVSPCKREQKAAIITWWLAALRCLCWVVPHPVHGPWGVPAPCGPPQLLYFQLLL